MWQSFSWSTGNPTIPLSSTEQRLIIIVGTSSRTRLGLGVIGPDRLGRVHSHVSHAVVNTISCRLMTFLSVITVRCVLNVSVERLTLACSWSIADHHMWSNSPSLVWSFWNRLSLPSHGRCVHENDVQCDLWRLSLLGLLKSVFTSFTTLAWTWIIQHIVTRIRQITRVTGECGAPGSHSSLALIICCRRVCVCVRVCVHVCRRVREWMTSLAVM